MVLVQYVGMKSARRPDADTWADTWVLVAGCAFAMCFTVWLTWGIWEPGIPFGDDNAAHVARTEFALDELYPNLEIDGWQPTFGVGYQEFLFVGPVFSWLAALVKLVTFGLPTDLQCFKAAIVLSYVVLPPAVAFLAWAFGLGKRAAGVAAILSLTISSPLGGAGLQSIFETGLVANQAGSLFFCLAIGGIVLILRTPTSGRVVFTAVAVALLVATHILTTIIAAFFAVALLASASVEWLLLHRSGKSRRGRRPHLTRRRVADPTDSAQPELREVAAVWPRARALGIAVLLAAALSAFVLVPMMVHGGLRGVSTAFPDVGLGERLPAIWRGDFLFRPRVAMFVAAGIVFELIFALRYRKLALTLVYTPFVFLAMARLFVLKMPGNIVAMQLTNRAWAYVGILVVLPLAHLLSWLAGLASRVGRRPERPSEGMVRRWPAVSSMARAYALAFASLVPVAVAVAIVVLPPKLGRETARPVAPTYAMVRAAEVLRDVVPDGARFVTQRLPAREMVLTGMTHPDLWLAAVTGKNTLNIWNAESSTVHGPVFEGERIATEPADAEADKLTRWGVTHVVLLDASSAPGITSSSRYKQIFGNGGIQIFEIEPSADQPLPSSLVRTDRAANAKVQVLGPGRYVFEVTASEATAATLGVAWSPKWRVTVNGTTVDPEPSEDRVLEVDLPAGTSRIEIEYRSDIWDVIGRSITLLTIACLIWLAVRTHRQRKVRPVCTS